MRRILFKCLKLVPVWVVAVFLLLTTLEVSYRRGVFDPYGVELAKYNESSLNQRAETTVLCMGDSVTAGLASWPSIVQEGVPDLKIVNAAIPGSAVFQANIVADRRFKEFAPSVFIYQVNVTNDLTNVRPPIQWSRLSPARNMYWTVSRRFKSIEYLNYRAGQLAFAVRHSRTSRGTAGASAPRRICDWGTEPFTPSSFTERERTYILGEAGIIEDQILLGGRRQDDHRLLVEGISRLLEHCRSPECDAFILVAPHAIQVEPEYLVNMRALGARIHNGEGVRADDYPFLRELRVALGDRPDVRIIDPLQALRDQVSSGEHVYFKYDLHMNRCGQEVLASEVLKELEAVN